MRDLTSRQEEILNLIKEWIETTGLPPTRMEIAQHFGFSSPNAAEQHLKVLAKKGALDLVPGTSRGIRLKGDGGVPLVGRVAAGSPILAQENIERHYQFDPAMFSPRADYLLTVRGMSMKDAGILDGDLLAVKKTAEARSGQIVVARLGDEVTVKRLARHRHGIELLPENPDFEPIVVRRGDEGFAIEGVAVGLIRNHMLV